MIGASTTIGTYIMPYIIHKFNKQEKDIQISMIIDNKDHIEDLLNNFSTKKENKKNSIKNFLLSWGTKSLLALIL